MTTLLEVVFRSSLIILLGLALMPLLRRQSAALRHWVLFTCVMSAGAMPLVTWLVPTWEAVNVASLVPPPLAERVAPLNDLVTGMPRAVPALLSTTTPAAGSRAWESWLLPIWMIGAVLSLAMLVIGVVRLRRIEVTATLIQDGPWHDTAAPIAKVRVTHRPGLLLVWGFRRPSVIVPVAALSWSRDRVASVMQHELAHIRRADWLTQIASEAVRAVYWFNPLVWIACARIRAECEIACDDAAIVSGAPGPAYATHVVEIARELNTVYWLPAPAIVRRSTLERRVRAMLAKNRNRSPLSPRARGAAIGLMLTATVAVAAIAAQSFVSLSGTIVDPTNGVLPGVKLVLVNEETRAKYEIRTDGSGRYEFVGLPPGQYTMDALLPGFARLSGKVTVAGQNLHQDLLMTVGMIEETVTVRQDGVPPPPDPERERRIEAFKQKRAQQRVDAAKSASTGAGDIRRGGNIRVPVKLRDFWPSYPPSLRGSEGVVILDAKIGTSGSVEDIQVASSSHDDFTHAAIAAVRLWEFDATLLNGEPIVTPMRVTVNFKLK